MKTLMEVYQEKKSQASVKNDGFAVFYWNMRIRELKSLEEK